MIEPVSIMDLQSEYVKDPDIQQLIQRIQQGKEEKFEWKNDILWYKGWIFLGPNSAFRNKILNEAHVVPAAGHEGFYKTYLRVKQSFFWKGMKKDIMKFVAKCVVCQVNKYECVAPPGLLQPLPIPQQKWESISMDFITGLPKSEGKDAIYVVVDRLTKFAHFIPIQSNYKAQQLAEVFIKEIYKLHGFPKTIISDRDPKFLSHFWQEMFRQVGTRLNMSTSYHPQIDGKMEAVNKGLENYLRNYVIDKQYLWVKWLHLAEAWYNSSYHSSIKMTPYQALYGYQPTQLKD